MAEHLDEIKLHPLYLSRKEKKILLKQYKRERRQGTVDPEIAKYLDRINSFRWVATIRSCQGHGYPGHVSLRFSRKAHRLFMEDGIKVLLEKRLCQVWLEAGLWLPTQTGIYFRWKIRFPEEKRDEFFRVLLKWLNKIDKQI